jgi:pimeloyl-ACP methyl ester carboxylesterase
MVLDGLVSSLVLYRLVPTREGFSMKKVRSKDGTAIALEQFGSGPPVVLISGASCDRGIHVELGELLAPDFTVLNYDRRGRGDSADTSPYSIEREIGDLDAVITEAGGTAMLFGNSSGAVLALHAAAAGLPVTKLALWEPPFMVDQDAPRRHQAYVTTLGELLDAGRRGDAMALFMRTVGLPDEMVAGMREAPTWQGMEAIAPTLAYDAIVMGDSLVPSALVASVEVPTLVLDGSETGAWAADSARALAAALPNPQRHTFEGQTHAIAWNVLVPVLRQFFTDAVGTQRETKRS